MIRDGSGLSAVRYGRTGRAHSRLGSMSWAGGFWRTFLFAAVTNAVAVIHLVLNPSGSMLQLVLPLG